MEENDVRAQFTSEGKRIITSITVENQVYYLDENKNVYEKIGNVYVEVQNTKVLEKVKNVLSMPADVSWFID